MPPPVICGNGEEEGNEACDDGFLTPGDWCEPDCTLTPAAGCGNGVLEEGEECDDGGVASGDGCTLFCQVESFGAGTLVITEVMQNPSSVTDGLGEWFEVYNPGSVQVDMAGWWLTDLGTNSHQIDPKEPLVVAPGAYVVLGIHPDPVINGGVPVDYAYATFSLSNGADAIQLSWQAVLIDAVVYDGGPEFPDPIGATMTLDRTPLMRGGTTLASVGAPLSLAGQGTRHLVPERPVPRARCVAMASLREMSPVMMATRSSAMAATPTAPPVRSMFAVMARSRAMRAAMTATR